MKRFFRALFGKKPTIHAPQPSTTQTDADVAIARERRSDLGVDTTDGYKQTIAFVDLMLGSANAQRRTPEQDAAQQAAIDRAANVDFTGVLTARYLSDAECRYIHTNYNAFKLQKNKNLWFSVGLVGGTLNDINDAINRGDRALNGYTGDPYTGVGQHVVNAVVDKWNEHGGYEGT
jgi:hypothetical protein